MMQGCDPGGYAAFLRRKQQAPGGHGFAPVWQPSYPKPFQWCMGEWAIRRGRAAMIADCGLGKTPMFLLCTATAAPNDYTELGTSSEAVGDLGHMDMLTKYFKNDQNTNQGQRLYLKESRWRFKGHAELPFWRWVCSWARACRKPSDLGFPDEDYALPPLIEREHVVASSQARAGGAQAEASLFDLEADAAAAIASAPDRSDGKGDRAYWDDQPEE